MDADKEQEQAPDRAAEPVLGTHSVSRLLTQLFDFSMSEIITTRMLPIIYGFAVLAMAALVLLGIVTAFINSFWTGLAWLAFGPIVFLVLVVLVRVLLEFVMAVFRMLVYIEILEKRTSSIEEHTEEVVQDLPRIRFWKSGRPRARSEARDKE